MNGRPVTGRLAPTPSGYLHLGNARSFLLAWLWARSAGGNMILRVEDIDAQRCKPEFEEAAFDDLIWLGLWQRTSSPADNQYHQSAKLEAYEAQLERLVQRGLAYPCTCSRRDIEAAASAPQGDQGPVYPGTCRDRWESFLHARSESGTEPAWRFRWDGPDVQFHDELCGDVAVSPAEEGDFVLWRKDGGPSYQLAVTVDDADQGVTQVLRGRDLLTSTARQLALYHALGLTPPDQWAHVPFVQDEHRRRMAKRDGDLSLIHLRESGVSAERVVAFAAWSAGLLDEPAPIAATELVGEFDLTRLNTEDFIVTDEHLDWLYATK